jgi:hypothetical protein
MSKRSRSLSRIAVAALSGAILLLPFVSQTASADPPWWAHAHGRRDHFAYAPPTRGYYVVRRPNVVVVQPVFPEAFVVRRPRFVVAQPVPVWVEPSQGVSAAIGIHARGLNVGLAFTKQHPYYGCSFCGEYFSSYEAWARHEQFCPDRPAGRVLCQPWDDDELRACQDQAGQAYQGEGCGQPDQPYYDNRYDYPRHGDPSYRGDDDQDDDR